MEKPDVNVPEGPAPEDLVIEDVTVGDGAQAQAGDTVEVHYVGVDFETGEEFDSSWDRKQSIEFPLDRLIDGWKAGFSPCGPAAGVPPPPGRLGRERAAGGPQACLMEVWRIRRIPPPQRIVRHVPADGGANNGVCDV